MAKHKTNNIRSIYFFKGFIAVVLLILIALLALGGARHLTAPTPPTLDAINFLPEKGIVDITGAGAPGSKVAILANGEVIGQADVDASGKWAYRTGELSPGDYNFQIANADNLKDIIASRSITVPKPEVTMPEPPAKPEVATPTFVKPVITEDGALVFTGTGEPGATLGIFANGKKIGEAVVGDDGKWQFDAGKLEPGEYDFVIKTLDSEGAVVNESGSENFTMPKPAAEVAMPVLAKPEITKDGNLLFTGTGEPGATLGIFANGKKIGEAVVGDDGKWEFDAGKLEPGEYDFVIKTLDSAGEVVNESGSENFTMPKPAADIAMPVLAKPEITKDGNLLFTGVGEPGATLAIFANGKKIGEAVVGDDGKWEFDAGKLEPGEYDFVIKTLDSAGEVVNESGGENFTMPKPAADIAMPVLAKPEITKDGNLLFTGTGEPGATLGIFANGKKIGEVVVGDDGKWEFDAGKLEPGEYDFVIKTLDSAGEVVNESSGQNFTMPKPKANASCQPYVVKPGDWLTKLALKYLGDMKAYKSIVEATNKMAAKDKSFTKITNPDHIKPGQKLCIPQK